MTATTPSTYRWLFWTLALFGFAADQASKYGVFAWRYTDVPSYPLSNNEFVCERPFVVIPDTFDLVARYSLHPWTGEGLVHELRTLSGPNIPLVNHGALFGIGAGTSFGNYLFTFVSLGAALAIVLWSFRSATRQDRYLCFALGLILAGTLGNFYDRLIFGGVRDFLHWYRWYDWPVFNFADCCLVSGAALLVLEAFLREPENDAAPPQEPALSQSTPSVS